MPLSDYLLQTPRKLSRALLPRYFTCRRIPTLRSTVYPHFVPHVDDFEQPYHSASIRERPAAGMAWAISSTTRHPVYVGRLDPQVHVGLACDCLCPACGAPLQAVNLREPSSSPRQPFFRHHVGTQGPGCKYRVAELAALKLLVEKGLIEIPAPRRRGDQLGLSGTIYQAEAVGSAVRERIIERRLVSETSAVLTLESGRKVALVLRGHQDVGSLGSLLAVVEVHVDDPDVAWLSPEEIIQRSELDAKWLHVVEHQQHADLQVQADDLARQQALDALDIDPGDIDLPVGATKKQACESFIHWAVKEALMHIGSLQAPALHLTASAVGKTGTVHTVPVDIPPTRLAVEHVAHEVLFDGYRADIVCRVRDSARAASGSFQLLVEVAVTNRVHTQKLRLIREAGAACIELDVMSFASGGSVTRPQLQHLVSSDVACKAWLHHPLAVEFLSEAQSRADAARDRDDAMRSAAELRQAEERRLAAAMQQEADALAAAKASWASSLSRQDALAELRRALQQRWMDRGERTSNGMNWAAGELEAALSDLLPRGLLDNKVIGKGGLIWKLEAILRSASPPLGALDARSVLCLDAPYLPYDLEPMLGLLHLAIDHAGARVEDGLHAYQEQQQTVLKSLHAGEKRYARQGHLDAVLSEMFPELAAVFANELGTRAYSDRILLQQQESRARVEKDRLIAEEAALAERERLLAEEAAEKERRRVPDAIDAVTYQWVWKANPNIPKDAETAVSYLKFSKHRNAGDALRQVVRDGFAARQQGLDFSTWFKSRTYRSVDDVMHAREVLEAGWLVQSKLSG